MKIEQIARVLQFDLAKYPLLSEHGTAPVLRTAADSDLFFLDDSFIREYARYGGLNRETLDFVIGQAEAIKKDEALKCLIAYEYFLYNESDIAFRFDPETAFPQLAKYLGKVYGAFFLLLALAAYPRGIKIHRERSIPEDIIKDTFSDLGVWCEYYLTERSVIGIDREIIKWLQGHCSGELLKIGRLQYKFKRRFPDIAHAWKDSQSADICLFAADGLRFNSEGLFDGVNDEFAPDAWTSTLEISPGKICGHRIGRGGYVSREKTTIAAGDFVKVLSPGDSMLDIHIPATGPMPPECCVESMRKALDLVPQLFPDTEFKGFICTSWMLDPHFADILKPHSNILNFHHLGHLFPTENSGFDGMRRVFGERVFTDGIDSIQLRSSMQKGIAAYLKKGNKLRGGGIFMLKEALEQETING